MILVFGKSGQVATELAKFENVECFGRDQADQMTPQLCAGLVRSKKPKFVVNAAAYTNVDGAETDQDAAHMINGTAPGVIAAACADMGIPFVHISTDYVFPGVGETAQKPNDPTGPLGAYGQSKLDGELAIKAAGGTFAIMRTSWVFSAHGNNFVKTMLRLGADRDVLTIVADQIGGPTSAASIAAACVKMGETLCDTPDATGTYHFAGGPDCSWADFAREIFAQAGVTCDVTDIPSSDFPTPAKRPSNSRMDCTCD